MAGAAVPILHRLSATGLAVMIVAFAGGAPAYSSASENAFRRQQVLTGLMLVHVAVLLDWLVRGPWRDPTVSTFHNRRPSRAGRCSRIWAMAVSTLA